MPKDKYGLKMNVYPTLTSRNYIRNRSPRKHRQSDGEACFWVIESKRTHSQIDQATREAQKYAAKINKGEQKKVRILSGRGWK